MFNMILFHASIAKQLKITGRTLFIYATMPTCQDVINYINMCHDHDMHTQYHTLHICRVGYYEIQR